MDKMTQLLALLLFCALPCGAAEFRLVEKLTAKNGVEFSTSATASPLIFMSPSVNPGNVGIGSTAPGGRLHVAGSAEADPLIVSTGTAAGSEVIRVNSSGFVGIGMASPGARLEVAGGSATIRGIDTQAHSFAVGGQAGAYSMVVATGGSVGVGTTAPAATLDVGGTGAVKLPVGTSANRPALPVTGMLRFNSEFGSVEFFDGTTWKITEVVASTPAATGGTETTIIDGGRTYRIHTFTSNGTLTFTSPGYVEVLVVAGGGSGGNHNTTNANGGGGGGGVVYKNNYFVSAGAYPVTVGAGGTAIGFQVPSRGNNGGNSVFGALTAIGGGGGGSTATGAAAFNGGSGGGGAYGWYSAGVSIQRDGYGNSGGQAYRTYTGGGGGGAGSAAPTGVVNGETAPGGDGGRGMGFTITGSLVFYAGGGGGGGNSSERAGDGWDGGGRGFGTTSFYSHLNYPVGINTATGGSSTPDALPNTGGGGGAGSYWSNNSTNWINKGSGAGGSGIVIVRYRRLP